MKVVSVITPRLVQYVTNCRIMLQVPCVQVQQEPFPADYLPDIETLVDNDYIMSSIIIYHKRFSFSLPLIQGKCPCFPYFL